MKNSRKPAAMTYSVLRKIAVVSALGLSLAAEAPRIGNAARTLSVKDAQQLPPGEEAFLENRIASCESHLTNVAKNITPQDRALL